MKKDHKFYMSAENPVWRFNLKSFVGDKTPINAETKTKNKKEKK